MNFSDLSKLMENSDRPVLAIAAPEEAGLLKAVLMALETSLSGVFLVGDLNKIKQLKEENSLDLSKTNQIFASTLEEACETAVLLVNQGKADLVMKGLVDTSIFLKAIIHKEKGLMTGRLLSSVMVVELPSYHKPLITTDGGMVIAPDLSKKKEILDNAIDLARALDINPIKVAVLAAKEKVNPKMPATLDAAELKKMSNDGVFGTDVLADGPIAMDLVVSKEAAEIKGYQSQVAGDADILLFPEIETGNAVVKTMTCLAQARLAGVVMGACVPVILTSRSESQDNKLNSINLGAYLVQRTGNCHDKREEQKRKYEETVNRK
ncbi:phosphate acyltransferase [Eubacteriaceae bacterium ES3]|nr:phosphate acyltransferase [Eubacteriaceae bacterium ES3]